MIVIKQLMKKYKEKEILFDNSVKKESLDQ